MVCVPFHTFVNTIRYKSNHPHNIIPEYAECQCRIYLYRVLFVYILIYILLCRYIIYNYYSIICYRYIEFILSIFRINYSELYIPYNSNHSGLYCRHNQYYSNKRLFPNIPNNIYPY